MRENRISLFCPGEGIRVSGWRDMFAKCALAFFCIALWQKGSLSYAFFLLAFAWIIDGGFQKFSRLIEEPLALGILVFCGVLVLGLLWGDYSDTGQNKWKKYFILLTFIPFLSLLNKERLPWVIAAFLIGYLCVLLTGGYQCIVSGESGVPFFEISYLAFSAMLGIGIILMAFLGSICQVRKITLLYWFIAFVLLFLQFHQSARGLLLATVLALLLLIFLRYRSQGKIFLGILALFMTVILLIAMSSNVFQERLKLIERDLSSVLQGNYMTSLGYRLAIWDVGVHGIAERPLLGYGTGMPEIYFEETIQTYKNGIYKNLPEFQKTSHYHNDWIEIGMHLGGLGIFALIFLLWSWFQTLKIYQLSLLGVILICYVFLAGLTDTFLLYNRIPIILLVVTAIVICWQKPIEPKRTIS
ncbi:O-antigen ligase [Nitrosomonas sp. Nm33]|uniref:O-antigen ligase family protein n=1 Tax=Nitrosomonas sp. Nm33 TaxID=133724 RepID=UPI00089776D7|nr:O-antigen ligase family protein [Nitrosomonas sp. Nm33]SDY34900.1 O-antigen ligase [Nitrosomonas sp. Nm33]